MKSCVMVFWALSALIAHGAWDDGLKNFQKKVGVAGSDAWAGIPRHPAVVNPPVRAEDAQFLSLAGAWELVPRRHGASARSLQEIPNDIRWGGQRNKWYASSGTDVVHRVLVPGCWEASGIGAPGKGIPHLCHDSIEQEMRHRYAGSCWYRKVVRIPAEWTGRRIWLKVGGIRARGWCYVNGHAVALCDAGVGAWKWEITDFVKPGEDVRVMVNADNEVAARGGIASSKNRWGGIVRDIEIEATPLTFIDDAWVRGDYDGRKACVNVEIGGEIAADAGYVLRARVEGEVASTTLCSSARHSDAAVSRNCVLEVPLDFMLSHYDEDLQIADGTLTWRFVTPQGATLVSGAKKVGAQVRGPIRSRPMSSSPTMAPKKPKRRDGRAGICSSSAIARTSRISRWAGGRSAGKSAPPWSGTTASATFRANPSSRRSSST